ncbi:DUF2243 domain-containing protein [Nocardioides dongxiaopingii]|uniref:DUF2243 domain-containing protein n=1 Tax=Nocardioides dongxiaopingii TaxID=2576036 RepID=UPI0010C76BDF|nr:DUF2243 domain-containing protein [Nocardioides dongxiaopingii]
MTLRTEPCGGTDRAAALPGFLYGIGLGGFVDGIVLHQILQWHHLVSHTDAHPTTTVAGLEANTLADGLFHVVSWLVVVAACVVTMRQWRAGRFAPAWRFHLGAILAGWGAFNLVEGVVDHHVLGIHHVRDDVGAPLAWDLGFLALGALLVVGGWLLARTSGPSGGRRPPRG